MLSPGSCCLFELIFVVFTVGGHRSSLLELSRIKCPRWSTLNRHLELVVLKILLFGYILFKSTAQARSRYGVGSQKRREINIGTDTVSLHA